MWRVWCGSVSPDTLTRSYSFHTERLYTCRTAQTTNQDFSSTPVSNIRVFNILWAEFLSMSAAFILSSNTILANFLASVVWNDSGHQSCILCDASDVPSNDVTSNYFSFCVFPWFMYEVGRYIDKLINRIAIWTFISSACNISWMSLFTCCVLLFLDISSLTQCTISWCMLAP